MKSSYYENTKNTEYDSDILPFLYPNDLDNLGWGMAEKDTILRSNPSTTPIDRLWYSNAKNEYYPLSLSQGTQSNEISKLSTQWKTIEDEASLVAGTKYYVTNAIGNDLFESLDTKDKDFLISASGLFDLGKDINIAQILLDIQDSDLKQ